MKRREFISLIGGAAALTPFGAQAQQATPPVVALLRSTRAEGFSNLVDALQTGLGETGHWVGRNIVLEQRWAGEQHDRMPAIVAELIQKQAAVIVANTLAAVAAKSVTATVPIVFVTGTDPVRDGLVTSFNRPGGNVTGVTFRVGDTSGKRLELLRQLVPAAETIAVLVDANNAEARAEQRDLEATAKAAGQRVVMLELKSDRDLAPAVASAAEQKAGALLVGAGPYFSARHRLVAALALRHKLPAAQSQREFAMAGGLMSYGTSQSDAYRQGGVYAGRILKGEKPGDLPVLQATKFEFVINMATAKALGLTVPMQIHAAADEVIE
jgi:putative ABC transport system substrate-binding protein